MAQHTVFRLFDMLTEEVSLVDRAANKRKFLVLKREGTTLATEVHKNPDGSHTTTPPTTPTPPAVSPAVEPPKAPTAKAALAMTEAAKTATLTALGTLVSMLDGMKSAVDGATVVEGEADMAIEPLCEGLMEVGETAEDLCAALIGEVPEITSDEPPSDEPPMNEPPMEKRLALHLAKRLLSNASVEKLALAAIAKVGRKMASRRAEKLRTAIKLLGNVWREIRPVTEKVLSGAITKADLELPASPPAVASSATSDLEKKVADMEVTIAAQKKELASLRKSEGSGALPVDSPEEKPHQWSSDIAADIRKQRQRERSR